MPFLLRMRDQWLRGCSAVMLLPLEHFASFEQQGLIPTQWRSQRVGKLAFGHESRKLERELVVITAL